MTIDQAIFEYGYRSKVGAVAGACLMWLLFAAAASGAAGLLYLGHPTGSIVCAILALLFLPYTFAAHRRARMRQEWRVLLRRGHATLVLPANRARHYATDWFEGEISYRDIRAIVRREEVYSNVGIMGTTMPYWLVLHDGRRILLGEDRVDAERGASDLGVVALAANAISAASGLRLTLLEPAEGKQGIPVIWPTRPPSWPKDSLQS